MHKSVIAEKAINNYNDKSIVCRHAVANLVHSEGAFCYYYYIIITQCTMDVIFINKLIFDHRD
jgi:hypothetical protein